MSKILIDKLFNEHFSFNLGTKVLDNFSKNDNIEKVLEIFADLYGMKILQMKNFYKHRTVEHLILISNNKEFEKVFLDKDIKAILKFIKCEDSTQRALLGNLESIFENVECNIYFKDAVLTKNMNSFLELCDISDDLKDAIKNNNLKSLVNLVNLNTDIRKIILEKDLNAILKIFPIRNHVSKIILDKDNSFLYKIVKDGDIVKKIVNSNDVTFLQKVFNKFDLPTVFQMQYQDFFQTVDINDINPKFPLQDIFAGIIKKTTDHKTFVFISDLIHITFKYDLEKVFNVLKYLGTPREKKYLNLLEKILLYDSIDAIFALINLELEAHADADLKLFQNVKKYVIKDDMDSMFNLMKDDTNKSISDLKKAYLNKDIPSLCRLLDVNQYLMKAVVYDDLHSIFNLVNCEKSFRDITLMHNFTPIIKNLKEVDVEIYELLVNGDINKFFKLDPTLDMMKDICEKDDYSKLFAYISRHVDSYLLKGFKKIFELNLTIDLDNFQTDIIKNYRWIIQNLPNKDLGTVFVCFEKYCIIAQLLIENNFVFKNIYNFIDDAESNYISEILNKNLIDDNWKFKAQNIDPNDIKFSRFKFNTMNNNNLQKIIASADTVLNLNCELLNNFEIWYEKIPHNTLCIFQISNIEKGIFNICDFNSLYYEGTIDFNEDSRFMTIGRK